MTAAGQTGAGGEEKSMRIRDYIFRIGAVALCVIMAAMLIVLLFMDRTRNRERAQALQQKTEEHKQQELMKMEEATDLYDQFIDNLTVTGIVCWGDKGMAGNGDLSLPAALRELADENLFAPVVDSYSKVIDVEESDKPQLSVVNMGVRNEGMREILARAGVNEMKVGEWVYLPGDTEPCNIVLGDETSWTALRFADQQGVSFGKTVIEGVEGTLTAGEGEYDEDHPRFAFVRDEEGDGMQAGAGTSIETESASKYLGEIPVFFFEDDIADSAESFVSDVESLVDRYTDYYREDEEPSEEASEETEEEPEEDLAEERPLSQYFAIVCTAEADSELDNALREAFGDHYIRNDTYAANLTQDGWKALAQKVYDALDAQGSFAPAREQAEKAVEALNDLSVQVEH